jgi:hypothetical protein
MSVNIGRILCVCLLAALSVPAVQEPPDVKLPNGKSQREEILKQDYQKTLREVGEIRELAADLEAELKEDGYNVLSVSALKKAERIEKLARGIRKRMHR